MTKKLGHDSHTTPPFSPDAIDRLRHQADGEVSEKHIVVWCGLRDLDSVLSSLEEYGFIRDNVPVQNPADSEAVGEFVGISGKMSDAFLIFLQQNKEVSAVEILK